MKTIFKGSGFLLLAGAASMSMAVSQEAGSKFGFIRVANAVAPGEGPLFVEIEGETTHAEGYRLGDITGGVSAKPGPRKVRIRRDGIKEGATTIHVAIDDTTILIPFAERVPASDSEEAHWAIRILRLKQRDPQEERSATFVSVSQSPELEIEMREPGGKWNPVLVRRLAIAQAPIPYPRGYAPVRYKDKKLESIPVGEPGNYVVLLYDDEEGDLCSINFRDFKFLNAD